MISRTSKYYSLNRRLLTVAIASLVGLLSVQADRALAASAVQIRDINPGGDGMYQNHRIGVLNQTVILFGNDSVHGFELWKSDGTAAGTTMIKDAVVGPESHVDGFLPGMRLTAIGDDLFYSGDTFDGISVYDRELWKTDGTAAGTVLVKDINPAGNTNPIFQTAVGNTLFFVAPYQVSYGDELWKSDGTTAGTVLVKDITSGPDGSDISDLVVSNGTLFFRANDGVHGEELWKTDGSVVGTVMVKDINPAGDAFYSDNSDVVVDAGGTLFFNVDDGVHGDELWKSDGTTVGTVMVKDINPTGDSYGFVKAAVGETLFFRADDGVSGFELWKSDGTAGGTVMVKDINVSGNSSPGDFLGMGGNVYFPADDGINGRELWVSDGSLAGTVMVKDINPGGDSNPFLMASVNGYLFFVADDGSAGKELWVSDGSPAGTMMVKDINPGPGDGLATFNRSAVVSGALVFSALGPSGRELWGVDWDSDELSDLGEATLGTDPTSADSDGDGIDDWTETGGGMAIDTDGDGIIDALDTDSDGDGIPDETDEAPLDPDVDGDGIIDGSDPDLIADAVAALPPGVFSNSGDPLGQRNAVLSRLADIQQDIVDGDIDGAIRGLRNLRRTVDGCGATADRNDWIVDCPIQLEIRALIDLLITNLGS